MTSAAVHHQTSERVRSAMTAAMRADPGRLATAAAHLDAADVSEAAFVRESRSLVLGLAAALTTVLRIHRPGEDPYGAAMCIGCGTPDCRTVRAVAEVLAAYQVRPIVLDRAEAWRRADAWFARQAGARIAVTVEEFDGGFVARGADQGNVLVLDLHTAALTVWPPLPTGELAARYDHYRTGRAHSSWA
ncbi:hypothetical protein DZF91_22480 [Actinomadura logoneensis]|uniref:Uncharacterized protein n=1 Tax=Actinomadura logoneensis TaxID=2293572 RepID=A0A372JHR6_9ACTN|nr:hypothetical protein [Actinomadura logoneensis]RFU39439.1 hypothetical protein DZF91_22480 [Actinomadura logoneensis]